MTSLTWHDKIMKLPADLLDLSLGAVLNHGYGSFFPQPPELEVLTENWDQTRTELADIDLEKYDGYSPIRSFAPKPRLNVRRTSLLHPIDLIFYTALVLKMRDQITAHRLPGDIVFSYRGEGAPADRLYNVTPSWKDFRSAVQKRVEDKPDSFVGITDIADFYPRIYHHRLQNALEAATGPSEKDYIRVLDKMVRRFSDGGGVSYGVPVGPAASRLLAEAILIDVDSTLVSFGTDFIRYVDDFVIFAEDPQTAEYGIRVLGETLFLHHGLTLSTAKTKVLTAREYLERHLKLHSEKEENRRKLLDIFGGDYEVKAYEDLDEELKQEVDAFNLSEMLTEALAEGENVDYREVSFILGRLSALQKPELIPTVIENLERLYPVAEAVAVFFKKFTKLEADTRRDISNALLAPILHARDARPSEYYCVWALSVFQHDREWDHAGDLLRIFRETSSDTVRRFAALALAKSGTRAEAVAVKEYLSTGSALTRTAMLLATANLGDDERKHLRRSLRLRDPLEKLCVETRI